MCSSMMDGSSHAIESNDLQWEMRHRLGTQFRSEKRRLLQFRWPPSRSLRVW